MGFFSRGGKDEPGPLTAFREPALSAGEPDVTSLLQELDAPFQRKDDAWLVEVGGAWAICAWIPRDATLALWLTFMERPGPSTDLVRAQTETGLAAYEVFDGELQQKVSLPGEHVDAAGLRLALASLSSDYEGADTQSLPGAPDHGIEAALRELGADPGDAEVRARGDLAEVRIGLGPSDPDEEWAEWMLAMSATWAARFGIDEQGTLWAISAVPGRPATAGGLAWALEGAQTLAAHYRKET